jgi:hypothetical protein
MDLLPQMEPTSTDRLLTSLGLAIDEAKLIRSIVKSENIVNKVETEKPISRRLLLLNREIELLETKLTRMRSQVN